MRSSNLSNEQLDQAINEKLAKWLANLEKHLPQYLTEEQLPVFYKQYRDRILRTRKSIPLSYEKYYGHAKEYIKRYLELHRKAIEEIRNKSPLSFDEVMTEEEESDKYYHIYSEIIDFAEKGGPAHAIASAATHKVTQTLHGVPSKFSSVKQKVNRGYHKAMHAHN